MSEKGNGRDRNDGRGCSDNHRRCKDEGGRSTCVRFGIRVGTLGFRKKNLTIYVLFQKIIIITKYKNENLGQSGWPDPNPDGLRSNSG